MRESFFKVAHYRLKSGGRSDQQWNQPLPDVTRAAGQKDSHAGYFAVFAPANFSLME